MENIFVEFLPPWVETGLQPAFYDKESGTVLQQTARMYARVNMLIRMFNKLSKNTKETVEEYINKFNELHDYVHDYFDNLDVQEEINNKLDDMAESGELLDIITPYLTSFGVLAFDNVDSLENSEYLVAGSRVLTYGYKRFGDGLYDQYIVREKTVADVIDGYELVELTNSDNLVAERVKGGKKSTINLIATDDINDYLVLPIKKCIVLPYNTTYEVTEKVYLNSDTEIDLNSSTLFFNYDTTDDKETNYIAYLVTDTFTKYNGNKNITFRNGKIKGGCGVYMHCQNILYENVEFIDIHSRHCLQIASCSDFIIRGCTFNGTIPANNYGSECINIDPCNWGGQPSMDPSSVMYDHNNNKNIIIENNTFNRPTDENHRFSNAIGSHGADDADQLICDGLYINNNTFNTPYYSVLNICDYKNVTVSNNIILFIEEYGNANSRCFDVVGGLENLIITGNDIKQCHQIIYSNTAKKLKKNIVISNNDLDMIDNQGSAGIQLFYTDGLSIINNKINGRYRFLHTDCVYDPGDVPDTDTKSSNVTLANNTVTMIRNSDVCLRIRQTENIDIDGNTFRNPNGRTENFCNIQTGVVKCVIRNNDIDEIYKFMTPAFFSDELFMTNNNWLYPLTSEFAGGTTSKTDTLWKNITNFSKIILQLGTDGTDVQSFEINPWYPSKGLKFSNNNRTWKIPVVKWDGTFGKAEFSISNSGANWSYTGDIDIKMLLGKD